MQFTFTIELLKIMYETEIKKVFSFLQNLYSKVHIYFIRIHS